MKFGQCKNCYNYKHLVSDGLCRDHADIPEISVGIKTFGGALKPRTIDYFVQTINSDPRVSDNNSEYDRLVVISDMEVMIRDMNGSILQKYEYYEESEVPEKTEDAIDWLYENY